MKNIILCGVNSPFGQHGDGHGRGLSVDISVHLQASIAQEVSIDGHSLLSTQLCFYHHILAVLLPDTFSEILNSQENSKKIHARVPWS